MPEIPQTSFPDIADVVSVRTQGELPVIVGGHAVNIWALAYAPRLGPQLNPYRPFTSKDLDLWGPREILDSLARKYHVQITLSPPRTPGLGHVVIPKAHFLLKVELLASVNGLKATELTNTFGLVIQGTEVRVLDAISCLKAKIANTADLDQASRQDVKHVHIMKICAREFAKDLLVLGEQNRLSERSLVNRLEDLRETLTSSKAETAQQKWGLRFDDVMPLEALSQSRLEKVQNFVQHRLKQSSIRYVPCPSARKPPQGPRMSF